MTDPLATPILDESDIDALLRRRGGEIRMLAAELA